MSPRRKARRPDTGGQRRRLVNGGQRRRLVIPDPVAEWCKGQVVLVHP